MNAERIGHIGIHVGVGALAAAGLLALGRYSYILFHTTAELFSITVAAAIFLLAWNARRVLDNGYLLFIGIAYLFIAVIDMVHVMAYQGMGVFPGHGPDLPTQLWIAARGIESLSLLAAPIFLYRRVWPKVTLGGYAALTTLIFLSLFVWGVFPVCYVEGQGLTPFKIVSEYVVCAILVAALAGLVVSRRHFSKPVLLLVCSSVVLTIISELAFTRYVSVYGDFNMYGHLLKILSFYLIYKAVVETGLLRPYELLFYQLREREELMQTFVEYAPAAIAMLDRSLRYVAVSRRWLADYGLTGQNIVGRRHYEVFPEIPDHWKDVLQRVLSGAVEREDEERFERADGTVQWIRWEARPWHKGGKGTIGGVLIFTEEISERKQAAESLQKARDDLERRVRERTADLSNTVATLREEIARRTQAERQVRRRSHQLRVLTSQLSETEQRERKHLAQILHDGLQQTLVAAKFRLAALDNDQSPVVRQTVEGVEELLDESIETSRSLTAQLTPPVLYESGLTSGLEWLAQWMHQTHGLEVALDVEGSPPEPDDDVTMLLFQAVRELLFNTVKHADVDSARVSVSQAEGELRIVVSDEGKGFDPSQLQAQEGGTGGFGLFNIGERLDLIGGRLEIDSAEGRGSRFTLTVPVPPSKGKAEPLTSNGESTHERDGD